MSEWLVRVDSVLNQTFERVVPVFRREVGIHLSAKGKVNHQMSRGVKNIKVVLAAVV